jgi:hypothetical protein
MIDRATFDDLSKRIRAAWGSDMTPEMTASLNAGQYRLIDNMRRSIHETLSPAVVMQMIDSGQTAELRALAEKCVPRMALIEELCELRSKHVA